MHWEYAGKAGNNKSTAIWTVLLSTTIQIVLLVAFAAALHKRGLIRCGAGKIFACCPLAFNQSIYAYAAKQGRNDDIAYHEHSNGNPQFNRHNILSF
jgi:hypothetical protein